MNKWFRKGNARRFNRINMPLRYFIVPSSPIRDREIYATGAEYFPTIITDRLQAQKLATKTSVSKVQEQGALITEIFTDIISDIEFFGECCRKISRGESPKSDHRMWNKVSNRLKGFGSIEKIKTSSPKTYQYFAMIEEKYIIHLRSLTFSIQSSTPEEFKVQGHLPIGFEIDKIMTSFKQPKFSKIPLVQALVHLADFLEVYLDVYRNINDDNYLRQYPQEWPMKEANVSASGLAVFLPKRFELYMKLDVYLYLENNGKVLQFDGSVVDRREDNDKGLERVAVNFEFPDGDNQDALQQEIQKQEVKECMKFALFS